jgi:fatty acid desaturase
MSVALPDLDQIDRWSLTDDRGRSFKDFRRELSPRFTRVWVDILGGYAILGATLAVVAAVDAAFPKWFLLTGSLGALLVGYVIAYIQLFLHEAVHYNIAKQRAANDVLANVFLGLMVGQNVKAYRIVHFDHHRHLGTPADTERSYFEALTWRFVFEALTGIKLVKILLRRGRHVGTQGTAGEAGPARWPMLLAGLLFNLAILLGAVLGHHWALALAWTAGMAVVHPFVNALRQLLEHRSFDAKSDADYSQVPHGPVTRMLGTGPIASTLGGAGFNRHLLHHWDPQLSYTRFAELEVFLLNSPAGDVVRKASTSYGASFKRLLVAK